MKRNNNKTQSKTSKPKPGRPTIKNLIKEVQDKKIEKATNGKQVLINEKLVNVLFPPEQEAKTITTEGMLPAVNSYKEIAGCRFVLNAPTTKLPAYVVRNINFLWDLKKSFWSNKLVFDRKFSKYSENMDFTVKYYMPIEPKMEQLAADLVLSKEKFDMSLIHLDYKGNKIAPQMLLVGCQVISFSLPTLSYDNIDKQILLTLNFKCNHVVFE